MANNELAEVVKAPAYLAQYKSIGSTDIDLSQEVSISYLKAVQKMSKEIDEGTAEYGDIINSVTKEKYEAEVNFVVVKSFINYKMFDKETFELKAFGSTKQEFIESAKKIGENLTENDLWKYKIYNFYIIKTDDKMRLCFSLGKTSSKTGKTLINMLAQKCHMQGLPSFGVIFTAYLQEEETNKKKYLVWKVKTKNKIVSEKIAFEAANFRKTMDSMSFSVHEEAGIDEIDEESVQPEDTAPKRRKF